MYHCSVKSISRSGGRSSVGAAAYRAGETITNERDGTTHDYTRKQGVVHSEIMLSEYAPREYQDRSTLWNAVEKSGGDGNARTAREIELALPNELSRAEQIKLVQQYVKENFTDKGMCADINIHEGKYKPNRFERRHGIIKPDNPHAHIMVTTRPIKENGEWDYKTKKEYLCKNRQGEEQGFTADEFNSQQGKEWEKQFKYKKGNGKAVYLTQSEATADKYKDYERIDRNPKSTKYGRENPISAEWNKEESVEVWREDWANRCNREFEKKNLETRYDHRSYERQGKDQIPTVHLGKAHQMERKGINTDRGNHNREVAKENMIIVAISTNTKELERQAQEIRREMAANARAEQLRQAHDKQTVAQPPKTTEPLTASPPMGAPGMNAAGQNQSVPAPTEAIKKENTIAAKSDGAPMGVPEAKPTDFSAVVATQRKVMLAVLENQSRNEIIAARIQFEKELKSIPPSARKDVEAALRQGRDNIPAKYHIHQSLKVSKLTDDIKGIINESLQNDRQQTERTAPTMTAAPQTPSQERRVEPMTAKEQEQQIQNDNMRRQQKLAAQQQGQQEKRAAEDRQQQERQASEDRQRQERQTAEDNRRREEQHGREESRRREEAQRRSQEQKAQDERRNQEQSEHTQNRGQTDGHYTVNHYNRNANAMNRAQHDADGKPLTEGDYIDLRREAEQQSRQQEQAKIQNDPDVRRLKAEISDIKKDQEAIEKYKEQIKDLQAEKEGLGRFSKEKKEIDRKIDSVEQSKAQAERQLANNCSTTPNANLQNYANQKIASLDNDLKKAEHAAEYKIKSSKAFGSKEESQAAIDKERATRQQDKSNPAQGKTVQDKAVTKGWTR